MSSSTIPTSPHRKALIGSPSNFWLHSSENGFDLTHPTDHATTVSGSKVTLKTTTSPVTVDPAKSALVIIDMQNFFLSEAIYKKKGAGHAACDKLIKYAIPAARKAGIRVVWLNWGLTDKEIETMPPGVRRAFGFYAMPADTAFPSGEGAFRDQEGSVGVTKHGATLEGRTVYRGLGAECGKIKLEDGTEIDGGRMLMRDSWNAALYPPLDEVYLEGSRLEKRPDVWLHKDRMSGLWGAKTQCEEFLEKEGIKTLFLAGVNTDQCVGGTLTDAFSKGYDCVLLSDGCGTSSPEYAQKCFEFNAAHTFGFCTTCEDLAQGVDTAVA